MASSMSQRKAILSLVSAFAVSALALAAIGLYGVMAYAVATRRREFGIRMALGAVRADVVREVLGGGLRLTGLGLLLGLAGAAASSRLLAGELFQVRSSDPAVLGGTMALLLAISFAACLIPAWRASQFESIEVLRSE
jgi:ABC-type antimicrobial peptide transport system permease subunit